MSDNVPQGAPDPEAPYQTMEPAANVYRMTFLLDVEATAPAIAKFRTRNLWDAVFGMMSSDQGVRLKSAIAAGEAAQYIRGLAALGDTEVVTHPFDLAEFERARNLVLAMAEGADVGSDFTDAAALTRVRDRIHRASGGEGRSEAADAAEGSAGDGAPGETAGDSPA